MFETLTREASEQGRLHRLDYLSRRGIDTGILLQAGVSSDSVKSNVENFIGTVSIPVGLAGPLLLRGPERRTYLAPIATTEGALVASMNRGAAAIQLSGGFDAVVTRKIMVRRPAFSFGSLREAAEFATWVESHFSAIQEIAEKYSKFAELVRLETTILGKEAHVSFQYKTGDASGQNMTTTCTWHACLWIEEHYNRAMPEAKIREFVLEGNGSADKKISFASIHEGRGTSVVAECVLEESAIRAKLKTTSEDMLRWYTRSLPIVSLGGMVGANLNVANAIAGIFTATGQDIASVHESAIGVLSLEKHERGLYCTLTLPRLVIGTVGGGTALPHQKKMLEIAGCAGAGRVEDFAKLIAGFCLALELSTISAMVSGQFAIAHERLGRNRALKRLSAQEIFKLVRDKVLGGQFAKVEMKRALGSETGLLSKIASESRSKQIGFSLWEGTRVDQDTPQKIIVKSKATDQDLLSALHRLAGVVSPRLSKEFARYQQHSEFVHSHRRESEVYRALHEAGFSAMPSYFGSYADPESESYVIALEYLDRMDLRSIEADRGTAPWSDENILAAIRQVRRAQSILSQAELASVFEQDAEGVLAFARPALAALEDELGAEAEVLDVIRDSIRSLEILDARDIAHLKTVTHNDFSPRNVALLNSGEVKIFDWELATVQYPSRDLIEFASFMDEDRALAAYEKMDAEMQKNLRSEGLQYTPEQWAKANRLALAHFVLTRVTLYLLGNSLSEYPFMGRLEKNLVRLNRHLNDGGIG